MWKNLAHTVQGMGTALPVKFFKHPPHFLEGFSGRCFGFVWIWLGLSDRMALLMLWICGVEAAPLSLNMGSRRFSANQMGAMVESGIMKLPCIWISLVVWWRWMVSVPRVQEGDEAVLREILRRRLTARPVLSVVSKPEVDTEEMMPLVVKE